MTVDEHIDVGEHTVPASELEWSFSPSGGPGGQHANRSHTRAELRFDLASSPSFPPELRRRMIDRLGSRAVDGVVVISVDESRSQWRNRAIAKRRLAELLAGSVRIPRRRRPTQPTRASRRRRVEGKRARSEVKRLRRRPEVE